jgi:hypothetical protein
VTPELADVIEAGRALNDDELEIASLVLLHGDAENNVDVAEEWSETVRRLLAELISGKVKPVSLRESLAKARAKSAALRDKI